MNCEQVAERLPWVVNGTLDGDEREQVRQHLTTCASCQRDLDETRAAAHVFRRHVPVADLIAFAFDADAGDLDRDLIRGHLERCAACREELALVRESRALDPARTPDRRVVDLEARRPAATWWRYAAIAAGLVAFTGVNVWIWTEPRPAADPRVAALQSDNDGLRATERRLTEEKNASGGEIARLEDQIARLNTPQINSPILEIFPAGLVERSAGGRAHELTMPAGATSITLLLNSQSAATHRSYAIEILDEKNQVIWRADGLIRHATGDYTVTLPAGFLRVGAYRIRVYGEGDARRTQADEYRVRVR